MIHSDRLIRLYDIVTSKSILDEDNDKGRRISGVIGGWQRKIIVDGEGNDIYEMVPYVCSVPKKRYKERNMKIAAVGSGAKWAMRVMRKW